MITLSINPIPTTAGCGTHQSTDWQVATDINFTNIIHESLNDSANLTSITFNDSNYQQTLYGRAKPNTTLCNLNWGIVNLNQDVNQIIIDSPDIKFSVVGQYQYLNLNPFNSSDPNSIHMSTIWEIKDEFNNVIYSTEKSTGDLLELNIPDGILTDNKEYAFLAKYKDNNGNVSNFGGLLINVRKQPVIIYVGWAPQIQSIAINVVIEAGPFQLIQGTDTHVFSNWWIEDINNVTIFQSLNDQTNLTSITIPYSTFPNPGDYTLKVQYGGNDAVSSTVGRLVTIN